MSAARVTLDNYAVMTSMLEFGNLSTDNTYYKRNVVKTFYKSHLPTPDDAAAALPPEAAPPAAVPPDTASPAPPVNQPAPASAPPSTAACGSGVTASGVPIARE